MTRLSDDPPVPTDDELDEVSRTLLQKVRELSDTERQKRESARSSPEFHDLAEKAELKALEVWDVAREERAKGREDSPIAAERDEQEPGDWTR